SAGAGAAGAELADVVRSPAQQASVAVDAAAVVIRRADLLPRAVEGDGHGHAAVAVVALGADAELTGAVATPAIGLAGGGQGAGVIAAGGDLLPVMVAADAHGAGLLTAGFAIAELAEVVVAPAVEGLIVVDGAGKTAGAAGADLLPAAGVFDRDRAGAVVGGGIAELAMVVLAPAV